MKRILKTNLLFVSFFVLFAPSRSIAQPFADAVQYLDYINNANNTLTANYLAYLSAVSHGKSARKVENRRIEVVIAINNTRSSVMAMPPWKGDKSFKDTTVAYLKILTNVFNDDYEKIVDMEEIAEQSYDAMEAYMLAQQKAYQKLNEAAEKQQVEQKKFAQKNNITLLESTSELGEKSKKADQVLKYSDEVYLLFFKSFKQEGYQIEAQNKKNLLSLEQNISTLKKYAEEGLEKLKTIAPYNGDPSLINACRAMLNFYKSEAIRSTTLSDFFLKEENFARIKKQFEAKSSAKRTKQDIDEYNMAVNDMNDARKSFNAINNALNKERSSALNDWNKTYNNFLDENMPKQRRQ